MTRPRAAIAVMRDPDGTGFCLITFPRSPAWIGRYVEMEHVPGLTPREPIPLRGCNAVLMNDEELTDAWEAGTVFPNGISHEQHLRIAWVLHRRYGPDEARARLMSGTKRACAVHGCPEKFDAALTERWAQVIADAIERDGAETTARRFLEAHRQFQYGDLLGVPDRQHDED